MISQLEAIEFLIVGTVSKNEHDCALLHLTWLHLLFYFPILQLIEYKKNFENLTSLFSFFKSTVEAAAQLSRCHLNNNDKNKTCSQK